MRLQRDERRQEVAEAVEICGRILDVGPVQPVAKHEAVSKADVEEQQDLARALNRAAGKEPTGQQRAGEKENHECLDYRGRDLPRLIPLERQQRRNQYPAEIPPILQVQSRRDEAGDDEYDVGLGAGQDRSGEVFVEVSDRTDAEIGELHQAESND